MRFARVLKVNRDKDGDIVMNSPIDGNNGNGNSNSPTDTHTSHNSQSQSQSCSQDPDAKGNFEICFHIKEAWNLFEVILLYMYMYYCLCTCMCVLLYVCGMPINIYCTLL